MDETKRLTPSQEDYLETIYNISEQKVAIRAKDIAKKLDVKASSVTSALKMLAKLELINYEPYDFVTLTDAGKNVAKDISQRHMALQDFLINVLGIDHKEANDAACKMEHTVPKLIVERLTKYAEYIQKCPKGGVTWDSGFGYYCNVSCSEKNCTHHGNDSK